MNNTANGLCMAVCLCVADGMAQDGFLDPSFGNGGIVLTNPTMENDHGLVIAVAPDGRLVVGGQAEPGSWLIQVYDESGTPDPLFGDSGHIILPIDIQAEVTDLAIQTDGKILATGVGFAPIFRAMRLLPDGSLDSSFAGDGMSEVSFPNGGATAYAMDLMSNASILLAGRTLAPLDSAPNCYDPALCRLLPDGSLDPDFGTAGLVTFHAPGVTANLYTSWLTDVAVASDGSILACGFTSTSPFSQWNFFVSKFDAQGVPDPDFGTLGSAVFNLSPFADHASSIALLPDGRSLVAGDFSVSGSTDAFLLRLNSDGSADPSFGDGGTAIFSIPGNDDKWNSVHVLPDGRIIATGTSGLYIPDLNTHQHPMVARYREDGSLDPAFGSGGYSIIAEGGHGGSAYSEIQADGKIVVAGTNWEGDDAEVAVYRVLNSLTTGVEEEFCDPATLLYPNPATDQLNVIWPESLGQAQRVDIVDATGRVVFTQRLAGMPNSRLSLPVGQLASGSYNLSATGEYGVARRSFIKQ